jgi:putative SOS response-associated peptidase YedK
MCGRYTIVETEQIVKRFDIATAPDAVRPNYNASPGQMLPVVTHHSPNSLEIMKWGLVPPFAQDPSYSSKYKTHNARSETVTEKVSYRKPFKSQRCLVPSNGFYEWQKTEHGKVPHYITLKKGGLFSFAGLYEVWRDAEGKELKTFTIITTTPNELMEPIHNRMPVILERDVEGLWLDEDAPPEGLLSLLTSYPAHKMTAFPVSDKVNKPIDNDESLIMPLNSL